MAFVTVLAFPKKILAKSNHRANPPVNYVLLFQNILNDLDDGR
jgi:hypothetical protein